MRRELDLEIDERLAVACSQLNTVHVELVSVVADAIGCDAWTGVGIRSVEHWLTWKAGVSSGTARRIVELARARDTHPAITAVFDAGELSVDQAAAAVKVPPMWDTDLAELAPLSTVAQIRTEVRVAGPDPTMPEPSPADGPVEAVSVHTDDDGSWHFRADLDVDHAKVVEAALLAARDRLFHAGQTGVTWIDALVEMADASLAGDSGERQGRFRVNAHLHTDRDLRATWADRTPIPDWLTRLLTCDGTVSPVFVVDGKPVSVGRTQRIVPERTRRIVVHRDGGRCRSPWCASSRWLDVHHIEHWEHDGDTDTDNLVVLCRHCHRAHHRGQFDITGNADHPDGLTFTAPNGTILQPGQRPKRPPGPAPMPARRYEHPLGERLDTRCLHFPHRAA